MRTREQSTISSVNDIIYYDHNHMTGVSTPSDLGPWVNEDGETRIMNDVVTVGFKRRRARGEIINNPMSRESFSVTLPKSGYSTRSRRWNTSSVLEADTGSTTSTSLSGDGFIGDKLFYRRNAVSRATLLSSLPTPSMPTVSMVLTEALAKASDSDALLLVSAAEARKTLQSIARATSFLNSWHERWQWLLRDPRFLSPRSLSRQGGKFLRAWLEVRYGLLPIYYDVLGYTEAVQNHGKRRRVRFTSYADGSVTVTPVVENSTTSYYTEQKSTSRHVTRVIRAGCLVEPSAANVEAAYSLGIGRIASSAWELVPFSFIVDWFLNTSKLIAAHEGRFNVNVLASWTTVSTTVSSSWAMTTTGTDRIISGKRHLGIMTRNYSAAETYTRVDREANPSIPVLPQVEIRLNWKKALDIVAIGTLLLTKLRGR